MHNSGREQFRPTWCTSSLYDYVPNVQKRPSESMNMGSSRLRLYTCSSSAPQDLVPSPPGQPTTFLKDFILAPDAPPPSPLLILSHFTIQISDSQHRDVPVSRPPLLGGSRQQMRAPNVGAPVRPETACGLLTCGQRVSSPGEGAGHTREIWRSVSLRSLLQPAGQGSLRAQRARVSQSD